MNATLEHETAPAAPQAPPKANTLVALATYNEKENLPLLVEAIHAALPHADILVVDDNSPDGTGKWCDAQAASDPRLHCLHRPGKLGLGTATVAAMQHAIAHGYEFMLNMDADFSHPPEAIPALVAGMQRRLPDGSFQHDVMIGSRYVAGGRIEGWPLRRHIMSRAVNLYARRLLGLSPRDCSGAFRCYRTSLLARVDFGSIRSRGYSFQEEILWRLSTLGARFGETPITFVERQRGHSKINLAEAVSALGVIFRLSLTRFTRRARVK